MYCSSCGEKTVPMGASFCWNCGQSLRTTGGLGANLGSSPKADEWEKCQIVRAYVLDDIVPSLKAEITFVAEVEGPSGAYNAAKSKPFTINPSFSDPDYCPKSNDREAKASLETLITKLVQDGWEQYGEGNQWFSHLLRRKVG